MTTPVASIQALAPTTVWRLFTELSAVPRPSKQEAQVRAHVLRTAAKLGLAAREDKVGNIVIEAPASPGCEGAPITVLQGHVDMVCEKNSDVDHDFEKDGIELVLGKDQDGATIVHASGTTLGADNGIGVCMALAAATDPEVKHGPLEILCTIDEEMGMTGAKALTPGFFRGRRMLNLDTEEDDSIYIGCAGGMDSNLYWTFPTETPATEVVAREVKVSGLRGGHSGGDIHENRGNAIKLLVRTLKSCAGFEQLQLAELIGGSKRNAIPREARAVVAGPAEAFEGLEAAAANIQAEARKYEGEPGCQIGIAEAAPTAVASSASSARVLAALAALPHGVLAIVPEIPDLVQTSNSTSVVSSELSGGELKVHACCLTRGSKRTELHTAARQVAAVGELSGATVVAANEYPGWAPDLSSPMLATGKRVYREIFGSEPKVLAVHAGLECGVIGEQVGGGMDMISLGPTILGAHSPDERVYVESVARSYRYLAALLAELAEA